MQASATVRYAQEVTLMDFTKHIIANLARDGVEIPSSNIPWYNLFYKLSKRPDAPEFLTRIMWDWNGPTPSSGRVSGALTGLVIAGWLSLSRPDLQRFMLSLSQVEHQMRQLDFYLKDKKYAGFLKEAIAEAKAEFALRR